MANRVLKLDRELRRHPFISSILCAICQELLTDPSQKILYDLRSRLRIGVFEAVSRPPRQTEDSSTSRERLLLLNPQKLFFAR